MKESVRDAHEYHTYLEYGLSFFPCANFQKYSPKNRAPNLMSFAWMNWHESCCILMDQDVFGACQTRQMYQSKLPRMEPQRGPAPSPICGGGLRPPPFVGACFRTFGVFDKLRRHQDPSKCIKIHANPSNPNACASGTNTIANMFGNLHPEK